MRRRLVIHWRCQLELLAYDMRSRVLGLLGVKRRKDRERRLHCLPGRILVRGRECNCMYFNDLCCRRICCKDWSYYSERWMHFMFNRDLIERGNSFELHSDELPSGPINHQVVRSYFSN